MRFLRSEVLAKSSGGVTLAAHLTLVGDVAHALLDRVDVPDTWRAVLQSAAALHDVGKADPAFQRYLRGDRTWVCHEDSTRPQLERGMQLDLGEWLADRFSVDFQALPPQEQERVVALATVHHGRRALIGGRPEREVALQSTQEPVITEFDLLLRYHPIGGVVVLADQIGSAIQGGVTGTLVTAHVNRLPPLADLDDEPSRPSDEDPDWMPEGAPSDLAVGSPLQRLLLQALGISQITCQPHDKGYALVLDGKRYQVREV